MAEVLKAWQCIGCGKVEADARCIGICEDRPVRLVSAADYEVLEALLRRLATITPREGQWERSYRALQREARTLLKLDESTGAARSDCRPDRGSRRERNPAASPVPTPA